MKRSAFIIIFLLTFKAFAQNNFYGDYYLAISDKIISLDVEGAKLVDILKMLSQQSGFNFVSTEAVRDRKLSLYLDKVPLKEAMDIIFSANNLSYDYYPEANIFVVKEMGKPSVELMTKVYPLKYVRVTYSRLQKEIVNKIEKDYQTQSGASAEASGGGGEEKAGGRGIKDAIKKLLTEFGKITEDPLTNSLIVTDVPSRFPMIDEVIKKLDVPLPMVVIETEMLDVSKKTIDKLGVNWPSALVHLGVTGTRWTRFPFGRETTSGSNDLMSFEKGSFSGDILSRVGFENLPANRFSPTVLTIIGTDLVLNYLKSFSDTKSLARPKIMTMANEAAEIKITTNEAIGVSRTESTVGGGTQTFTIEREETGTRLRVTPQVDIDTGEITLFVEMVVKGANDSEFQVVTNIGSGYVKNPEERSATAVARLKDGETLLLGGLIKNDQSIQRTKLPLFGDIPLIGKFFSWKYKNNNERELLVFLTPRIVSKDKALFKETLPNREQASLKKETIRLALDRYSK
ncbi:MAG: hypothetical protein NC918_07970 [Candidatus Omnitrophica bacterium]|nr:hypothetical protein [Candidatus Omnitrophota bacterium]